MNEKSPFYLAVEKMNIDIINLLIQRKDLNVNIPYILKFIFLIKLKNKYFNKVLIQIFRLHF